MLNLKACALLASLAAGDAVNLEEDMLYIKSAGANLYLHSYGGSKSGAHGTLHTCKKIRNYPNCQWTFQASDRNGVWYVKASDKELFLHAHGGARNGAKETLHTCTVTRDYPNCQWVIEESPTRSGHVYIKSRDANLYLHAHGGSKSGNKITLHSCTKSRDYPNCQWKFEKSNPASVSVEDFSKLGNMYIKSADAELYFHSYGGSQSGKVGTLHSCNKENNYGNCQWSFSRSHADNAWYIKASDAALFAHAHGGARVGASETLHPCPVWRDHANCQWIIEPSPTRSGHFYIKSRDENLYLHTSGGSKVGNRITLHSCWKDKDYPNCQWTFHEACANHKQNSQCDLWAKQKKCSSEAVANLCPISCGRCLSNTEAVMVPHGYWLLRRGHTGGSLVWTLTEGVETSQGVSVTTEHAHSVGVSISQMIAAKSHFLFGAVESETTIEVNYDYSYSVAEEVMKTTAKSTSEEFTVNCDSDEAGTSKVWLYQWVVQQGRNRVLTPHTRCQYTATSQEQAPECPLEACGGVVNNSLCELDKCLAWQADLV